MGDYHASLYSRATKEQLDSVEDYCEPPSLMQAIVPAVSCGQKPLVTNENCTTNGLVYEADQVDE